MKRISYKSLLLPLALSFMAGFGTRCTHEINRPIQAPIPGRIVINKVLYNPVGNNSGNQLIELKNIGSESVELNNWWFCARQDYAQIPNVTVGPGEFLVTHVGASGTNTTIDVFLASMLPLQTISDLNLYRNSIFQNPASMVHFVQWGGVSPIGRESEAVAAGFWKADDFVPGVAEGHSIEYDGNGNSSADWVDQSNPTIGF